MTRQEYKDIYDIVGIAQEVHATLGRGMAESVYQEAMAIELGMAGMEAEREKPLRMSYKGVILEKMYYADFYYHGIIVELKAVDRIISDHRAQLFNYMRITTHNRGLLLNFGEKRLRAERYLYTSEDDNFILLTQDNYKKYIID